jgi:hypothetical protein
LALLIFGWSALLYMHIPGDGDKWVRSHDGRLIRRGKVKKKLAK